MCRDRRAVLRDQPSPSIRPSDRTRTVGIGDTAVGHYTGFVVNLSRLWRPPVPQLACLLVASRLALLSVGLLSTWLLPSGLAAQRGNLVWHEEVSRPLEIWARWDSEWYLLIADRGYDVGDVLTAFAVPYEPSAAAGFLPLYPVLIGLLRPLVGLVGAGVLISNWRFSRVFCSSTGWFCTR